MIERDEFNLQEAFELARETIRAVFALNGGAAIAVLAFYGQALASPGKVSAVARSGLGGALSGFSWGAFAATAAFVLAYLTQHYWGITAPDRERKRLYEKAAGVLQVLAILSTLGAMGLFVEGVASAKSAIVAAPAAPSAAPAPRQHSRSRPAPLPAG